MKSLKINIYLLTLVMVVIFGCKKTGREGPAGPAGPAGAAGQNGTNGNANVKSHPFSHSWKGSDFPFTSVTIPPFAIPDITQDIIVNGAIIGYVSTDLGATWILLPHSISIQPGSQTIIRGEFIVGQYIVKVSRSDGGVIANTGQISGPTLQFKIVTISK